MHAEIDVRVDSHDPFFESSSYSSDIVLAIEMSGADRRTLFCGPMFVPAFVLSQPNFKVK